MSDTEELRADRYEVESARLRGFAQAFTREGRGGVPLLLVHGWPESRRIWWRNIADLAAAGFDVVAPDLRGFGDSDLPPDGICDIPANSRDLYALAHDHLGFERIVAAAGDFGGPIVHDLSLRFPGFVDRIILFNAPVPNLKDRMKGLRIRPPREAIDYYIRQGTDPDGLAAQLGTAQARREYIATFYISRFWARPGAFSAEAVAFMTEPFADGAKLRASFGPYVASFDEGARSERAIGGENPTHTLILHGTADHVIAPDFDRMAAIVYPDHVGPFSVPGSGHFLQWEAADLFDGTVRSFCRDLLAR